MHFPAIDPVFLRLGPLEFRWYGLMYVISFVAGYFIILREAQRRKLLLSHEDVADLVFAVALGVILGGRAGYVLFYNLSDYIAHPMKIFAVWEGGMSFHGGFIGAILGGYWFVRKKQIAPMLLADICFMTAPVGLCLGRIGNFINGELYGRVTEMPWGVVFPGLYAGSLPRHPSQLYEAILEGPVMFFILWLLGRKERPYGVIFGSFVALYGLFRFLVEFFREPDIQLGFIVGQFSMGQLLSLPMAFTGVVMVLSFYKIGKTGKE